MATYVMMIKEYEDDEKVVYFFGPDKQNLGRIQINKATGDHVQLDPVPNSKSLFYLTRAVVVLTRYLEKGIEFPDKTHYAS